MPRMSGKELAAQLEAECPGVSILFMSGYTDDTMLHSGMLETEVKFLQKPFSPLELVSRVRETLLTVTPGMPDLPGHINHPGRSRLPRKAAVIWDDCQPNL